MLLKIIMFWDFKYVVINLHSLSYVTFLSNKKKQFHGSNPMNYFIFSVFNNNNNLYYYMYIQVENFTFFDSKWKEKKK